MSDPQEIGKTINVDGIATHYHDSGDGPPVVLLHGSGPGVSAWANWRPVIPGLGRHFRVIAPDIVGFGHTQQPEGFRYEPVFWAAHLQGFLDVLGMDRVHLIGNSFGGGLALQLATSQPDRVGRLVLMGSVGTRFDLTPGLDAVWGYEPSVEAMRRLLDIFAFDRSLISDELAEVRYQASALPGAQEAYASMFPAPRQRWIDALALADEDLKRLPHETLILHGRDDLVIPLTASIRLAELIDRAQLHVFGRCGHWTQIEHTARFTSLVTQFLSEDPAGLSGTAGSIRPGAPSSTRSCA
jgi:2-hydroxymuconate-semialdehyde hydrolase